MFMLLAPSQISKSSNGASFEVHFGRKARRTGLLICYSISHKVIIQLTCALMQRCTLYSLGVDVNQVAFVCDNAPCHSKVQELEVDFPRLAVTRLGPYSPMLNPIENVWSKMKSHIKRHMRVPAVVCPGVVEQRLQYVETKIDETMATIT